MGTWRNGSGRLTVEEPDGSGAEAAAAETVAVEIAASYGTRRRGLLGRDGIEGALLITPCNSVHTFRMRFAIDVAYLDKELRVVDVHTLKPGRLPLPRWKARHVLEAEAGAMERWGLRPGARITVDVQNAT
ncbi:DUF192 domain-containing protein [Streptomyces sp. NBC_01429]|uniref:DUF192 domain-containing protein n=1 Tax=Streptomyces sp. NBC_01429 TaxID=2903862 RepID=UPI002E2D6E66|nr:DUF192 domain-containing protein [Streptomyces sp. NBC_01429]